MRFEVACTCFATPLLRCAEIRAFAVARARLAALAALVLPVMWLSGCATAPPRNPEDLCAIFRERTSFFFFLPGTKLRWTSRKNGACPFRCRSPSCSRSRAFATTPSRRAIICWGSAPGRVSSAYGYAQAKDETWTTTSARTTAGPPAGTISTTPWISGAGTSTRRRSSTACRSGTPMANT